MGDAMRNLPGDWLVKLSARLLDAMTVESLVEPTIADLQHEVAQAGGDVWHSWLAQLRGYSAVVRLLFTNNLVWRTSMRGPISVLALGIVGAASLLVAYVLRHRYSEAPILSVFLIMAIVAPVVLRRIEGNGGFRQLLLRCLGVGMTMATAMFAWMVFVEPTPTLPWYGLLWRYLFLAGCVALGSALASAAAWRSIGNGDSVWRERFLAVLGGATTCAACSGLIGVVAASARSATADELVRAVAVSCLLGFYFSALAFAVYLPVLAAIGRILPRLDAKPLLATTAAMLFPVPVLAVGLVSGHPAMLWQLYLQHPTSAFLAALPYIVAGVVLGWLVASRCSRVVLVH